MRKYEAIWIQVKTKGSCQIAAPTKLHARIKKAVTKEKWKDLGYKVSLDAQDLPQPELAITVDAKNPDVLTFRLHWPITIRDL